MKVLSAKIENFMGLVGDHDIPLDSLGLVHVGRTWSTAPRHNSNGSGKTTILEAITWGLFGEGLPRPSGNAEQGVRADEVLNDQKPRQCRVSVDLEDEDKSLQIVRWRKYKASGKGRQSNGATLIIDGETREALDEKETNRLICEAIGITRDIWCRGVIFGQESAFNFCSATTKQRSAILTTVMGLGEIDIWIGKCREEKSEIGGKLAVVASQLGVLQEQASDLKAEDPAARVDAWRVDQIRRAYECRATQAEITERGRVLADQLGDLPTAEDPEIEAHLGVPDEILDAYQRARCSKHEREAELRATQAQLRDAQDGLDQIKEFNKNASCPTCRQKITDQHRVACLDQASRDVQERDRLCKGAGAARVESEEEYLMQARIYAVATKDADRALLNYQERSAARVASSLKFAEITQQLATERANWLAIERQIADISEEINPHLAYQAELDARIQQTSIKLAASETVQEHLNELLDVRQWWDQELPRFKTWMFDSIVDVLSTEANRWLGIMSGGVLWIQINTSKQVGKLLKDELDIQIYRWNADGTITTRSYRTWSGGEKRRVALAVDLGLSRLLAGRASKSYSFLALDEVDRHLDDRGKDGLRQVLSELRADKETVISITHDPEFRASFDSEILVIKERGTARLEITNDKQAGV